MANSIIKTTILDGSKWLVVNIHIEGDGSGDETDTVIIDASAYSPAFTKGTIYTVESVFNGFNGELSFDATANVNALALPDYISEQDFHKIGGIPNSAGAGRTGDILLTTVGLGANDHGHIIIKISK